MDDVESQQQYREKRCEEIATKLIQLREEISFLNPRHPQYNRLEAEIIRLVQETSEVLFYTITTWESVKNYLPIRVYELDHRKFRREASAKLDSHLISEVREGIVTVEDKEVFVLQFYCQECRMIVAKVDKSKASIAPAFVPWSESQRI
jgi:hypothetical protein